jgi:pyridoxamine 5'-phosphate oxidase
MDKKTLAELRRDYSSEPLLESAVSPDPFVQFGKWMDEAFATGEIDGNAMAASTVDAEGRPSSRVVLLKGVDEGGFVFFTNYESKKAADLACNENVFLLFFWPGLHRQISISGIASKISREESEQYFATRPRESQAGAWASHQSSVIASRDELESSFADVHQRFEGQTIPCPPFWGGYRVVPGRFEFWQGRASRLHDRICYTLAGGEWQITRLAP